MPATITTLASGIKLLSFQGVTLFQGAITVATIEADLIRVAPNGTVMPWVNLTRYGIPTGIVGCKDRLIVVLSGQESGHFLVQVTATGAASVMADLSPLTGEFGAPFAVAAYDGYYPYYLVAISTDVIGSAGLIARVTPSGKASIVATLAATPFGIALDDNSAIVTQENGQIVRVGFTGETHIIANFQQTEWGIPLNLARSGQDWIITTTTGWLVALKPDRSVAPVVNLAEADLGLPTTLTSLQDRLIVLTQAGNLVTVDQPLQQAP